MDFVLEIPNSLSSEKCEQMIKRFEGDDRKRRGVTAGANPEQSVKKSMDLTFSGLEGWKDIDEYLQKQLTKGVDKYKEHLMKEVGSLDWVDYMLEDTGYQIQKTTKGEYYSWHKDGIMSQKRIFTFLWYLNDIDPIKDGGGTAFHPSIDGGKVVKPEQGKLLLFPATWTYLHMGLPLITEEKNKYICTGWIRTNNVM